MSEHPEPVPRLEDLTDSLGGLGGDAACWAHLLCEECGIFLNERGEHRAGCSKPRGQR